MFIPSWTKRLLRGMIGGLILAAVMGPTCIIDLPGPPVTVELINTTDYYVDPGLYIHPEANVFDDARLITDQTLFDIGDPLAPLEVLAIDFRCSEAGTVVSDFAWLFVKDEIIVSENGPLVTYGRHFWCGDTISFFFVDTIEGFFYTEVRINGVVLTE